MTCKALFSTAPSVEITVDEDNVSARKGEPLAAVFLRLEDMHTRTSLFSSEPRAPFCMMGVCYECLVEVEGIGTIRSCQQAVDAGMKVQRHDHPKRLK